jgi:hypothetical protein
MMNIPEEHKTDPKYGYVVGGMFLLSKWIRENTPTKQHKYKVGDIVSITVECEVLKLAYDCDGTPLYTLESVGGGWSENALKVITCAFCKQPCFSDDFNQNLMGITVCENCQGKPDIRRCECGAWLRETDMTFVDGSMWLCGFCMQPEDREEW